MNSIQKVTTLALAGSMSLGFAAVGVSAAGATPPPRASSVNLTAHCGKGSAGTLQVQREDNGTLSVDVGVDMARHTAGIPWRIKATDNGAVVVNSTVRTISDGSFSVTRLLVPKAGANHVVFYAKNLRTGETCRLNGIV